MATITYDANGGTNAPEKQTISWFSTLSSIEPIKDGYTFLGWATTSSATAAQYQPGDRVTFRSDVTLYAVWQADETITYTITYNANGGSGAPSSQTKTHGVVLILTDEIPSRAYTFNGTTYPFTFLGWATTSSATTAQYKPGDEYKLNQNVTLYAVWQYSIKITYDANGGKNAPGSQTITYTSMQQSITLSSTKPTKDGYTFLGWATTSSATTAQYQPGQTVTSDTTFYTDVTLYAVWEARGTTYTITFNANGGSGAPSSQTKTYGQTLTLSSTEPTRAGYTFQGWGTSATTTTVSYQVGGSYTNNSNITLYAIWKVVSYSITYNLNGGSVTGNPTSYTIETPTFTLYNPSKSNQNFLGWSAPGYATTKQMTIEQGTIGNLVFTAVWSNDSTPTLIIDPNGGTYDGSSSVQVFEGKKDSTKTLSKPTRTGYTFGGWFKNYLGNLTSNMVTAAGNMALFKAELQINKDPLFQNEQLSEWFPYACAPEDGTFSFYRSNDGDQHIFNIISNGVSNCDNLGGFTQNSRYTVKTSYGNNVTVTIYCTFKANIPVGYYLQCDNDNSKWLTDNQGTGDWTIYSYKCNTTTSVILYSSQDKYEDDDCQVSWKLGGLQFVIGKLSGTTCTDTFTFEDGNTNLQAQWIPERYTITFNSNGGSNGPTSQTKTYGQTLTLSSTKPTRTGYTFQGWSTSSTATSAEYSAGGSYTNNSDIILYAVWKANIYTITLDNQSATTAGTEKLYLKYNTGWYSNATATTSISKITCPSKTGYTFGGYYTLAGGSGTKIIEENGTIKNELIFTANNTTLYAYWINNPTYEVIFNGNGATSGDMQPQTFTTGIAQNLNENKYVKEIIVKYDYNYSNLEDFHYIPLEFNYWNDENNNTYTDKQLVQNLTLDNSITLFANWSSFCQLKEQLPVPERNGYEIDGWYYLPAIYKIESDEGTTGFSMDEDGYYKNNNSGINNSYSICRINFDVITACDIIINCKQDSEKNYDYGFLSYLDGIGGDLSHSYTADTNYKYSCIGSDGGDYVYEAVTPGKHYIDIKYRKDVSVHTGSDTFKFKVIINEIEMKDSLEVNTDITFIAKWKAFGTVRIYTNDGWKQAIPYIYNGNGWKQAIPYIYDGNNWKIST